MLALLVNGHGNGEIARQLGLSAQTASNYVSAVYGKLNVSSRAELAVWAREHDLSVPT